MKRRVVVTGTGTVSPLGHDTEILWENIKLGNSGIKRLTSEDFNEINTQIAGYIEYFQAEMYLDSKEMRRYDLFIQYAYAAAVQAINESRVNLEKIDKDRAGVYIGS